MLRRFCRVVRLVASLVAATSVQADDLETTANQMQAGPIVTATLPYAPKFGLHGKFSAGS